ncbi:cilia- and flagella-associated protein 206-like [Pollicipes pollicipes]|uniref:cilia- and flagella-associated protein 206-like n=1 Tax=Pollicipes pollicipes TaxID=41117 RepID=UPI0018859CEE|nr:cilia- and flagella-associated protein 206-like [Pollicipes pollicipes]
MATPIEELIRRLIKRILSDCHEAGVTASETLAAFTIKAVVLSPRHACLLENLRQETDADRLAALCVRRLTDLRSPAGQLVRMQVFFETSYMPRGDVLADHGRMLQSRLAPVVDDIVAATAGGGREELELLYRRVVALTILVHGLGDPTEPAVEREATAALHSVFPPAELGNFLALRPGEKRLQLGELADIVAGVRLFNRDAKKGGEGIEDLPGLLERAVSATRAGFDRELQHCAREAARYNAVVRQHVECRRAAAEEATDEAPDEESLSAQFVRLCREVAAHYRQFELYLRVMLGDVGKVAAQLIQLREEIGRLLGRLHRIIDVSPAVPANVVLPLFVELADAWRGFQVETVCLSTLSTLHGQLQGFMHLYETEEVVPQTWLEERLRDAEVVTDAQQFERNRAAEPVALDPDSPAQVLPVERLKNFPSLPIQYQRLCPHALVDGGGQLLIGDSSLGVAYYCGRYYCCSSPAALAAFAAAPYRYTSEVEAHARRHPELIHLLDLEEGDGRPAPAPLLMADRAVQTELHPAPAPADPDLSWNEWQMRRRALLLADLRGRRTHGVQTERSHLRRDQSSQMFAAQGTGTQTTRDDCSAVPRPQTYLHGLRGRPDAPHGTVNLTPGVEEE